MMMRLMHDDSITLPYPGAGVILATTAAIIVQALAFGYGGGLSHA